MQNEIEDITHIAIAEANACNTQDELRIVRKRWDEYFIAGNKHLAGKGALPYMGEKGKVSYVE